MMMYKKLLAALFLTASTVDMASASTRARQPLPPAQRIQKNKGVAFFRPTQQVQGSALGSPLTGWMKEFVGTVKEDFAQHTECNKEQIVRECVVSYGKGLVGKF